MSANNETFAQRAKRIKGYCEFHHKSEVPSFCTTRDGMNVEPIIINSLDEYIKHVTQLQTSAENPLFFHGHADVNYLMIPTIMRADVYREHLLYDEFRRRFPEYFARCETTVEKIALMQHYGLYSRCLDLSESPFVGLHFAVQDMIKFRREVDPNKNKWGEVVLVRMPEDQKDDIKTYDSSTVSVISNIAMLKEDFTLQELQLKFLKDSHLSSLNNYIYFKDIMRRSVILRTKQDFPRVINQRGAFIMVNANALVALNDKGNTARHKVTAQEFSDFILSGSDGEREINLTNLKAGLYSKFPCEFKDTTEWDFKFKKINPYSLENENRLFQDDPFDLKRLLYKNKNGSQVVFLIPPEAKIKIKEQLQKCGITEEFVYPEMDSVSYALNEKFGKIS